jgi:site-specific DNA recombinase
MDVISNTILETEYLNKISEHVKKILKDKAKNDDQIRLSKNNQLAETKQSLKKIFMILSKDEITADKDLNEILDDLKSKRNTLAEELEIIKRRSSIPIWKFGDKKKLIFIKTIKKVLLSGDKRLTKAFLRTIISKIDVKPTEVTIIESNIQMLNAISKAKVAASNEVPTFVSMWRRDRDLNPIFST